LALFEPSITVELVDDEPVEPPSSAPSSAPPLNLSRSVSWFGEERPSLDAELTTSLRYYKKLCCSNMNYSNPPVVHMCICRLHVIVRVATAVATGACNARNQPCLSPNRWWKKRLHPYYPVHAILNRLIVMFQINCITNQEPNTWIILSKNASIFVSSWLLVWTSSVLFSNVIVEEEGWLSFIINNRLYSALVIGWRFGDTGLEEPDSLPRSKPPLAFAYLVKHRLRLIGKMNLFEYHWPTAPQFYHFFHATCYD